MRCFHVLVVRHAAFYFTAQRNAALRAKAKLQRPINDRFGAGLDSDLIKPGVARFGQRLDEIQRSAIGLFPIVESDVANLDCRARS